ncbi:hypothetical protein Nepgr_016042 [Nepenthes gracilis]|uniref:Uncharacterized protein n=1 Tax=Nepenthes gracilis TaxID=150966 RepID=A0AAD3SPL3_NEPGR|nr:hypothetical protein Nepgr_016042 [Nepenthes gracilis]
MRSHDELVIRSELVRIIVGGINHTPLGPVNDLVEDRRLLSTFKAATVIGGPDQVLGVLDRQEDTTALSSGLVREEAKERIGRTPGILMAVLLQTEMKP